MSKSNKSHSTPEFTEAQYRYLARVFGKLDMDPSHTLSEVMYNAGEQHVIGHIEKQVKVWVGRNGARA